MKKVDIAKNLLAIKNEIKPAELIAVTKYSTVEEVIIAYDSKQYDFGENRLQDLKLKANEFKKRDLSLVRWHFIGHLQTNKVRELLKIPNLFAIHSIDSIRLLEELFKRESDFKGSELKLFLQVKTTQEETKSGFSNAEELKMAVEILLSRSSSKIKLIGLMTMGPIETEDFKVDALRAFKDLSVIASQLEESFNLQSKLKLSMGMSQDYKLAIMAGSDYVRIGSSIFK